MVEVKNISYTYPRAAAPVLTEVGFDLPPGACMAILGNNGAGKSTLLKCIDRIYRAPGASVLVDGEDVLTLSGRALARRIAYVPQSTTPVEMTVFDAVLLGRRPYLRWDVTRRDREIVARVLDQLGLTPLALRQVSELSGGEVQKVLLARALAQEPRLLLLDEPTSNLDPRNQHEVLQLVRDIARRQQLSVVAILHDLNLAIRYCDRFLFLKGARVYAQGGREVMTPGTIEVVYGLRAQIITHGGVPLVVPLPVGEEKSTIKEEIV